MEALALSDSHIGKRSEPRTNLAVMVSMVSSTVSGPVMICNLSTGGALIECDRLPEVGERVELRRGEAVATGHVMWKEARRAGLQFEKRIKVAEWQPASHAGQQAVDKVFQQMKGLIDRPPLMQVTAASTASVDAVELRETAERLDALADTLASDDDVIARHSTQLQVLDLATQILRKLAAAG